MNPDRQALLREEGIVLEALPALAFKVGYAKGTPQETIAKAWLKQRYHAPSDDVRQPEDLQAASDFNRIILSLAQEIANNPERPKWKEKSFFRRFAAAKTAP